MKKIFYILLFALSIGVNAQTYLIDNFNYTTNDSLLNNGWVLASSTVNPLRASAAGLTYTGYAGSGVGNAVPMANNGQDLVKDGSLAVSTGSIYCSFLMNVSAAQAGGDYFFGLVTPASTTAFFARTYIRATTNPSFFQIGVSKASTTTAETAVYQTDSLSINTTYLVILKYQFNTTSTTDDSVKVFTFSSGIPATEPGLGKAATIGGTNTDATSLQRVLLRQGSSTTAATLTIDGIRFNANWAGVALPVKYTAFSASKLNNSNLVKWTTASETNNSHFEIQRSVDGKNFEAIGKVKGAGNSSKNSNYSFSDKDALSSKTIYYRLKQVDFDGVFEYSKTVSIVNTAKTGIGATLPNPFNNSLSVTLSVSNATNAEVAIMDMLGKTHQTTSEQLETGSNTININTADMPDGIYFVRVTANGETFTQKVIKK